MRAWLTLLASLGCGRLHFEPASDADSASSDAAAPCEVTCTDGVAVSCGSTCMFICPGSVQQYRAEDVCAQSGGTPLVVHDATENACAAMLGAAGWIGLNQTTPAAIPDVGWTWYDGSPFSYNNWNTTEPDDGDGIEDDAFNCAYLDGANGPGLWSDEPCDLYKSPLCRR